MTDDGQTDRETDHATEKCVGIGGISCAARTIPPNNTDVCSADGSGVVDFKTAPFLTNGRHVSNVLGTAVVQDAEVRERVATLRRRYAWQRVRSQTF